MVRYSGVPFLEGHSSVLALQLLKGKNGRGRKAMMKDECNVKEGRKEGARKKRMGKERRNKRKH